MCTWFATEINHAIWLVLQTGTFPLVVFTERPSKDNNKRFVGSKCSVAHDNHMFACSFRSSIIIEHYRWEWCSLEESEIK